MAMNIPRPEYPRPQFIRDEWLNLNGEWEFEIDYSDTGIERKINERKLNSKITVPFCPESKLSGVNVTDFMEAVWYRKTVTIPENWNGKEIILHFQAVDYETTVWVNGKEVGRHRGGFSSFEFNLGEASELNGQAEILLRARDPKNWYKPGGKQSTKYEDYGCFYHRTTGIWQTVWMEPVSRTHFNRPKVTPNVTNSCFLLELPIAHPKAGWTVTATLKDSQGDICTETAKTGLDFAVALTLTIPEDRVRLWQPGDGQLYDIDLQLADPHGQIVDSASTYAGLRSVAIDGYKVLINGQSVFQRLVLDQGFYSDGILTAPSDEALVRDITLSMRAGFNGARLHQKVFEERFLYHADMMGYLVWGEFGDWGATHLSYVKKNLNQTETPRHEFGTAVLSQWAEVLQRDYSHPAIIGWCPLNETLEPLAEFMTPLDDLTRALFYHTKNMDLTRPVLDASGYAHRVPEVDIYDCHDYKQDPVALGVDHAGLATDQPYINKRKDGDNQLPVSLPYDGQPYFVSEFGGARWSGAKSSTAVDCQRKVSWGYGDNPKTIAEFMTRFQGLVDVLLDNPKMFGYCYTQLTDVFQEQNGLFYFDRRPKFDMAELHAIQTRKAAIED